jgi:hypothetical protein
MAGFTKLVPEIVESSLWNESSDVRIVWIYMLAKKDQNGYVRGDAATIARLANVPLESAQLALTRFQEPDPNSHTPDNEGRRIAPAPGGWMVLNHFAYRDNGRREYLREYMRKRRCKQDVNSVNSLQVNSKQDVNFRSVSESELSASSGGSAEGGDYIAPPDATIPTLDEFRKFAVNIPILPADVEACYHYYAAAGFMRGNTRLVDFRALLTGWAKRSAERAPRINGRKRSDPNI